MKEKEEKDRREDGEKLEVIPHLLQCVWTPAKTEDKLAGFWSQKVKDSSGTMHIEPDGRSVWSFNHLVYALF